MAFKFETVKAQTNQYTFDSIADIYDLHHDVGIKTYSWNNGILCLGYSVDSTETYAGMTISFFDTLGNQQWKDTIRLPAYDNISPRDIIALNNSSFYVTGIVYQWSATQFDMFFAKFDVNGDSIFYKIYSDSTSKEAQCMDVFSHDTILLLSNMKQTMNDPYYRTIISKLDTLGNIVTSDTSAKGRNIAKQILNDSVHNKIYVGGTNLTSLVNTYIRVFVDVHDSNLNLVSHWVPPAILNDQFIRLNLWNNQLYLTQRKTVFQSPNPHAQYQNAIGKFNIATGSTSGISYFGPIDDYIHAGYPQVLNNNCIIIPTHLSYSDSIYFIDSLLNPICKVNFRYPGSTWYQYMGGLSVLPSKKVAGTGYVFTAFSSQAQDHRIFLTVNMEDYLIANCGVTSLFESNLSENTLTISPNPAITTCTITSTLLHTNTLTLYDITGRALLQQPFNATATIDMNHLTIGIYIAEIKDKEGRSVRGKVVKE